jgi:nitrite reductase/ring-hydroxylating ferredoxin subunit
MMPKTGFVVVPVLPPHPLPDGTMARSALIGRTLEGVLVAYANVCRHLAIPLDYGDGEVMDDDKVHLVCHHHGAVFRPGDGECVVGPCYGDKLWPLSIREEAGQVSLVL